MARLRRVSDAAEDSDPVRVPTWRAQRQPANTRKQSPRSKRLSTGSEAAASDRGNRNISANLVLKNQVGSPTKSTQVRLVGLSVLSSSNSLTSGLILEDVSKAARKVRRGRMVTDLSLERPKPRCTVKSKKTLVAQETDGEESIWCGSIDDSDSSSGEGLMSPRTLFALPRKSQNSTAKRGPDLTKQLQALSIFDDHEDKIPFKKRVSATKKADTTTRRNSSSDRENYGGVPRLSPPQRKPHRTTAIDRPATPPTPASPSKSKLQSPSKKAPRIPTPPLRPSLDAFWTADAINDWNDQYSPQKPLKSPRKLKLQPTPEEPFSPSTSPNKSSQSPSKRTKAELAAIKDFNARKMQLADGFLSELDQTITGGRIQSLSASTGGVQLIWSNTLNTTAGRANWRRETTKSRSSDVPQQKHFASIELATKVISTEHRLLNVLAHEFCHLANFMISGVKDQPHGKQFKEWGRKVTDAFGESRGVEVTTKHTYEIDYKYVWRCGDEECGVEFKRHSKSIDPTRQRCGKCRGLLMQIKPVPRKVNAGGEKAGVGTTASTPGSVYASYVKEHFAAVRREMPGKSHKEVMEALGRKYRAEKEKTSVEVVAIELGDMNLGASDSPVVIDSD